MADLKLFNAPTAMIGASAPVTSSMPFASNAGAQMTMMINPKLAKSKRHPMHNPRFSLDEPELMAQSAACFKKDLLWKPLVRRFRRYLKKEALSHATYSRIFSKPVVKWGSHFCKAFEIPEHLAGDLRT